MSMRSRCQLLAVWLLFGVSLSGWAQSASPTLRLSVAGEVLNPGEIYLFPDVAVGARSAPVTFTLDNLGEGLALAGPAVTVRGRESGMFVIIGQPLHLLPAGGSVSFRMAFVPTGLGPQMARVTIDASGQPSVYSFLVAGNGVEP